MSLIDSLNKLNMDTVAFRIICYITFKEGPLKPSQIAEGINTKPSTVRARLAEMKEKKLVIQSPTGYTTAVKPYDILMKLYRDIKKQ